jgi:hypothetical protein
MSRSLCEVSGFLRAVREARALRPDLPRAAFVAAARTRSPWFSRLSHVDAETVIDWAARAARRACA